MLHCVLTVGQMWNGSWAGSESIPGSAVTDMPACCEIEGQIMIKEFDKILS